MTIAEMADVLELCQCNDYSLSVMQDRRGAIYLQASYMEPDTVALQMEPQRTRRWFLNHYKCDAMERA